MKKNWLKIVTLSLMLLVFSNAYAKERIEWWHAMGGALGEKVNEIAKNFNAANSEYELVPVYKGNYTETMTAAIAAFRAKEQPHIVQVFEVGTASMMAAKGAVYPVYKLMSDHKEPFNIKNYIAPVVGYYTTKDGKLLSMPFNSSTPVLYYNKDAFKKAGLNPENPPKTWEQIEEVGRKLIKDGGMKCGFTTGWQSWVQLENFSAWHNLPIATKENGFESSSGVKLLINSPLHVKHIETLSKWQKENIFRYGGRRSDSDPLFVNGECGMLMNSSAAYAGIKKGAAFEFGVANLPYYSNIKGAPQNSIIGGATLWVLNGHKSSSYKGVAKFFSYLSKPEVQADWHQSTGYLPITNAAYELTKKQGFYDKNKGTETAIKQITNKTPTKNSKGLRLGNFVQIRDLTDEELENVWSGKSSAKEALNSIVSRGDELLKKFEEQTK